MSLALSRGGLASHTPKKITIAKMFQSLMAFQRQAGARNFAALKYLPVFSRYVRLPVYSRAVATQSEQFEFPPAEHHSEYHKFRKDRDLVLKKYLEAPNRFQQIGERKDKSDTSGAAFRASFDGKYFTLYRGFDLMKGCHDMVIYTQLFWYVKPATVIEIGAYSGGTAVWMADMLKLMNVECSVYSMDIDLSLIDNRVKKLQPDNVKFVHGDCHKIEEAFTPEFLRTMRHPLVIIEDAHENFPNTLEYFHNYMKPGDYFIVDDTNPHTYTTSGMAKVYSDYKEWGPGKLNQLRRFLTKHNKYYAVDSFFTDFFGYNGTGNWNGYIRRMC